VVTASLSALITGASRGIGLAVATRLAEQGYRLSITARDAEALDRTATALREAGSPDVVVFPCDMAHLDRVAELAAFHGKRFDTMDVLVLNAGVGTAGDVVDYPMKRLDKTVDVNLRAPFAILQGAIPLLRGAAVNNVNGSRVIAMSSITGLHAERGLAAYGATKAALLALVDAVNLEEVANGVLATSIAPAFVDTDMSAWAHSQVPPSEMLPTRDVVTVVEMLLNLSPRSMISRIVLARSGTDGYRA
jgi:NAD(P)-dependent dehydrogenase (short-subunit alcohol dehydrogenase family)